MFSKPSSKGCWWSLINQPAANRQQQQQQQPHKYNNMLLPSVTDDGGNTTMTHKTIYDMWKEWCIHSLAKEELTLHFNSTWRTIDYQKFIFSIWFHNKTFWRYVPKTKDRHKKKYYSRPAYKVWERVGWTRPKCNANWMLFPARA